MNLRFPPKTPDGQSAAHNLPQRHQVGIECVELAGAAERDAEAGHDFVDDQQRAVMRGELAQSCEISLRRNDAAGVSHDGLDDDGGDRVGMRGKRGFHGGKIVVGQRQRQLCNLFRHARRAGNAECRHAGAGFDEQPVGMAVIAALKFDDDFAARWRRAPREWPTSWLRCRS